VPLNGHFEGGGAGGFDLLAVDDGRPSFDTGMWISK